MVDAIPDYRKKAELFFCILQSKKQCWNVEPTHFGKFLTAAFTSESYGVHLVGFFLT